MNRIGLVLSSAPGYSETFFRSKIKGLQASGFEVVLFVDYGWELDRDFPCKVVVAPDFTGRSLQVWMRNLGVLLRGLLWHPQRSWRLYRLDTRDGKSFMESLRSLLLNQFLLVEDLDWLHFGFGMLAVGRENVAAALRAKMAVSFRGYDLYLSPLKHPGCYQRLFKKEVQYHVLSQEMKSTLIQESITPDHIQVISPAIDSRFFKRSTGPKSTASESIKVVTIARLHWKKGLEYTLEALAVLKDRGLSFRYTLIGDGEERERLVFAAHQLGLSDRVHFAGRLSPEAVRAQLEQADVYLQYSIQEGFCNAVLEAQAMGLLCIVSNAEGLDENVLDKVTGWVIPKRQPQLLAKKMMEVISLSPAEQNTMRNAAIKRVQQEFDLQKQHERFRDFYGSND